jgi:hypothetical protein
LSGTGGKRTHGKSYSQAQLDIRDPALRDVSQSCEAGTAQSDLRL